jgi:SAM-dependent methyltransferase
VRAYYDRHTPSFVAFGEGGRAGAIHRAVWGPGVHDRAGAFHYVEDRIAAIVGGLPRSAEPLTVVDLGCGVGGSLRYLAARLPIRGVGVTLSPVQVQLATRSMRDVALSDRIVCLEADYCDLPASVGPADVAYAIESFVHGPDPARFFQQCHRLLRPGGVLILCDDFSGADGGAAAARATAQFRDGWQINTLLRSEEMRALANAEGFEHVSTTDLSPYLELHRIRDRAIAVLLAMSGRFFTNERVGPLRGGTALQACLARGWIRYELVVLHRR